ncbi:DUF6807 domain-containing protein [Neorhodopirellula pilleata]|uniref:DUF6807 domain-containing protein n=1 Tax=Neorhodopirellula pilleata TaxID=2714738 RepID=UPI001E3DCDE3|nr:PmoA family protein [Neorhodopirellula pilleata]
MGLLTRTTAADEIRGGDAQVQNVPAEKNQWSVGHPDGDSSAWEIRCQGELVTTYYGDLAGTPGFFPVKTPSGLELTRRFPIGPPRDFEKEDHDHHRSFWFTHGIVNGLDFWIDDDKSHVGKIVQRESQVQVDGNAVVLTTKNDWQDHDGQTLLSDVRRFRFTQSHGDTVIDTTIELIAGDGDVTFGDTKEGSFGVRVAGTMKVDAKKMDKRIGGTIINAEGLRDADTWSKPSAWVDYSGPLLPTSHIDGTRVQTKEELLASDLPVGGITMMYHPTNHLPECRWHVRTYGLFAANPFARRHFGLPEYEGVRIRKNESLTLDFRVVLHDGLFDEPTTKQHYLDYSR